jgi:prepilin-type N-terminal cleavage/methylation domain-containing protein
MRLIRQNAGVRRRIASSLGFTLVELLTVVAIGLIITVIAIPIANSVTKTFQLKGAVASAAGVIKATRYQAIAQGYPMQVVITKATATYQIQADPTKTAAGLFDGNFVNVGNAEPLSGSGLTPTLGANITLYFSPSGKVSLTTAPGPPPTLTSCGTVATPPPCQIVMTFGTNNTETITVSAYGNIDVTP